MYVQLGTLSARISALYARPNSLRPESSSLTPGGALHDQQRRLKEVAQRMSHIIQNADRELSKFEPSFFQTFISLSSRIATVKRSLEEQREWQLRSTTAQDALLQHIETHLQLAKRVIPPDGRSFKYWQNSPTDAELVKGATIYQDASILRLAFHRIVKDINQLSLPWGSPSMMFLVGQKTATACTSIKVAS